MAIIAASTPAVLRWPFESTFLVISATRRLQIKRTFLQTQTEPTQFPGTNIEKRFQIRNGKWYEFPADVEFLYDFAVRYGLNKRARLWFWEQFQLLKNAIIAYLWMIWLHVRRSLFYCSKGKTLLLTSHTSHQNNFTDQERELALFKRRVGGSFFGVTYFTKLMTHNLSKTMTIPLWHIFQKYYKDDV